MEDAMREKTPLVLALLLGIAIGALAVPTLNAQTASPGTYVVAETHVTDPAGFTEYVRREPATLAAFHGRVLARALPDVREGTAPDGTVTIYGFSTPEDANRWYNSSGYQQLLPLRQHAATSRVYFLTGVVR
jgi:uncharacterized protein (DUF1330 family)